MIKKHFYLPSLISGLLMVVFLGCSTVSEEAVKLSYIMGENLSSIKMTYISLINTHFDLLGKMRIEYLENEWVPKFIEKWVEDGHLLEVANGKLVWSPERKDFIAPASGMGNQGLLQTVNFWSIAAIEQIEGKRKELIDPLEDQRKELLSLVEESFDRLYRGNAAITAHLNSLRKIQEMQEEMLKALSLTDLQKEINIQLQNVSKYADEGLEAIRTADGFVDTAASLLKQSSNF
jgi:hypothetical protein